MTKVALVVLHFGEEKNTIECLESISRLLTPNFELSIIVVDNGTENKFKVPFGPSSGRGQSSKFKVDFKIIRNGENLGFAGGNNVGISQALKERADYVLILNNDTIVDKNLVGELLKVVESNKRIGIVVPKIYFAKGCEFHKDRYKEDEPGKVLWYAGGVIDWKNVIAHHRGVDEVDTGRYDKMGETEYATGCCMLVKREVFEGISLLDKKYYLYYEDSDFSMRVKNFGFRIVFAPKAKLWHKNAGAAGGSGSELQDYYITRNRLLFGMRYAPIRSKISLIRESLRLLFTGREWQKRGVMDFYGGRFGKGSFLV